MRDIRINATAIEALAKTQKGETKKFLWDREVPGFGVYKNSRGRPIFVYQYRMPGGPSRREKIGYHGEISVTQARDLARVNAHKKRQGIDPIQERRERRQEEQAAEELVVSNYFADYDARRAAADNPIQDYVRVIFDKDILPNVGDQRIDRLDAKKLETVMNGLGERSRTARRQFIVYFKMLLNDAKKRGKIGVTPMDEIETPQSGERDRFLDQREVRVFCEAAHDFGGPRGDTYECILRLMKRHDEVAEMPWEEIDQTTWTWSLPAGRSKTKVGQTIVLPQQVVRILNQRQPDRSRRIGLVFADDTGKPSVRGHDDRVVLNAHFHRRNELDVKALQIPNAPIAHFVIHDLRTTGATWMQRKPLSIPPHVIEAVLNHSHGGKVKKTYQRHMYVEEVAEALQKWNDLVDEIVGPPSRWPGGGQLPEMDKTEIERRHAALTKGWPKRSKEE